MTPLKNEHPHIQALLKAHPIVLFMKGTPEMPYCGFSRTLVKILQELSVPFQGIDVLQDEELRQDLKVFSSWPTFPQLYVEQTFIGGCDIARHMFSSGELGTLLKKFQLSATPPAPASS